MEEKKTYHIGKEIHREVERQGYCTKEFAAKINTSQQNVFNIYRRESLNTDQLIQISRILHRNFLRELSIVAEI